METYKTEHEARVGRMREQHEIAKKAIEELVEITRESWKEFKKGKKEDIFLGSSSAEDKIQLEFLQYGAETCNGKKGTIKLYDKSIAEKQIEDARTAKKENEKKKKEEEKKELKEAIREAVKEAVISERRRYRSRSPSLRYRYRRYSRSPRRHY